MSHPEIGSQRAKPSPERENRLVIRCRRGTPMSVCRGTRWDGAGLKRHLKTVSEPSLLLRPVDLQEKDFCIKKDVEELMLKTLPPLGAVSKVLRTCRELGPRMRTLLGSQSAKSCVIAWGVVFWFAVCTSNLGWELSGGVGGPSSAQRACECLEPCQGLGWRCGQVVSREEVTA